MKNVITIRLDAELARQLDAACQRSGKTCSETVREALRRELRLAEFDRLRALAMPFAEARGFLTDDDVFREIS